MPHTYVPLDCATSATFLALDMYVLVIVLRRDVLSSVVG